jgi:hypothetical protein
VPMRGAEEAGRKICAADAANAEEMGAPCSWPIRPSAIVGATVSSGATMRLCLSAQEKREDSVPMRGGAGGKEIGVCVKEESRRLIESKSGVRDEEAIVPSEDDGGKASL